ncbi:hypothetical protein [Thalassobaculum sp.]|uniref:hypothetical protein n=1 Tax=Thalassobaculum sp. TaxID=2022740 RepID=UPI0032F0327A
MTGDSKRLSSVDRRSMKILASSTKASGPNNARIAERLEKAAGTGDPSDYRQAERSFDSLPAIERRRIGTHAEKQAEKHVASGFRGSISPPEPTAPTKPKVDDTLEWQPLIRDHSPATDPAAVPPVPKPRGTAGPAEASPPKAGKTGPGTPPPAPSKKPGSGARTAYAGKAKATDKSWDWQKIPEDPVNRSSRKKPADEDPFDALRREMMGDKNKSG